MAVFFPSMKGFLKLCLHAAVVVVLEESVRNFIPLLLPYAWFVIFWVLTWDILQSKKVKEASCRLYGKLKTGGLIVSFLLVGVVGAGISITYWLTIQRVISVAKRVAEPQKHDSPQSLPAESKSIPSAPAETLLSEEAKTQIIRKLINKYKETHKSSSQELAQRNIEPMQKWVNDQLKGQGRDFMAILTPPAVSIPENTTGMNLDGSSDVILKGNTVKGFVVGFSIKNANKMVIKDNKAVAPK
jgi:hypothetical protein